MRKSNKQKRLLLSAADIKKELAKPNVDFAKKFLNDFIVVLKFIKSFNYIMHQHKSLQHRYSYGLAIIRMNLLERF